VRSIPLKKSVALVDKDREFRPQFVIVTFAKIPPSRTTEEDFQPVLESMFLVMSGLSEECAAFSSKESFRCVRLLIKILISGMASRATLDAVNLLGRLAERKATREKYTFLNRQFFSMAF